MIETTEVKQPRLQIRMPFVCESPAIPGFQIGGFTRNVSQGGALLHVAQPLVPGARLNLLLLLGQRIARANGYVAWSDGRGPGNMGVRFTELNAEDRLAWDELLATEEDHCLRSTVRIPVGLTDAHVLVPDGCFPAHIKNLSDTGLMLSTTRRLDPGTLLTVGIPSWRSLPRIDVEAEVRWAQDDSPGEPVTHGLRLLDDDTAIELFVTGVFLRRLLQMEEESPLRSIYLLAIMARELSGSAVGSALQPR